MSRPIRQTADVAAVLSVLAAGVAPTGAETTLVKVARTGTLLVGTRTGSPPFGFVTRSPRALASSCDCR